MQDGGKGLVDQRSYDADDNPLENVERVGIMFIIILVGLLADKILFSPVESWLHRRWGTGKE
ncbi:MAG: hypothetical protein II349_07275 [Akkermansia sp.]|nr:hypothetical protein [Akkermansia sp.]